MSHTGRIFQINVSPAGGVPKQAVRSAAIDMHGIAGNAVANKEKHGGPTAAICLYALERILALQGEGHPLFPGSAGENITITGLDWDAIVPGTRLQLGDCVLVEITRYTSPCQTIAGSFRDGDFNRISQKTHAGWSRVYAQVLTGGAITTGDPIAVR
ncbi:MAG: MOSC domain-containing protein [Chloroflexi bacterium]|nr:MOSC domain-containing protein [Chloroflexota bacterium]